MLDQAWAWEVLLQKRKEATKQDTRTLAAHKKQEATEKARMEQENAAKEQTE